MTTADPAEPDARGVVLVIREKKLSDRPVPAVVVEEQLNQLLRVFARNTSTPRVVRCTIPGVDGRQDGKVVLRHVPDGGTLTTSFRTTRADLVRVSGTEEEKLEKLRDMSSDAPASAKSRAMERDASRLDEAVQRASLLRNPSFRIYGLQRKTPLGFEGAPPPEGRPLRAAANLMATRLAAVGPPGPDGRPGVDEVYKSQMLEALAMGDYTTHDPASLHPRFLEYVHERVTAVPRRESLALAFAQKVMRRVWDRAGVTARARGFVDTIPDNLSKLLNPGSPGEFSEFGIMDRKNTRLLSTMSRSLERFFIAGQAHARQRPVAPWVNFTQQPVMSFGKTELKAAKMVDGRRAAPVPRFIFNLSPINYCLAAFLHSDLSHSLRERDPTHGPGFGPARGRAGKLLSKVESQLAGVGKLRTRAIMSDIAKWDANMCEVLISASFDLIESAVDKTGLDATARATRKLMCMTAKRQLMQKIVEHPSGFFVELFGCMPSGSYYTSMLNTVANDMLAVSLLGSMVLDAGRDLDTVDVDDVARVVSNTLISYGDNQLIFEELFTTFGFSYTPARHAEHLRFFGMTLKEDETDVSDLVGRVRFCSRGVVQTPKGLAITRSHSSLYSKLGGRPHDDPLYNKLYVRALMVDLLGTDPGLYRELAAIDEGIHVPPDFVVSDAKVEKVVEPFARRFFGRSTPEAVSAFVAILQSRGPPNRRTLLSLSLPRKDRPEDAPRRFGSDLVLGASREEDLDEVGKWLAAQDYEAYTKYLRDTGQLDVLVGN
ncbi:RNA-dependent RNA polymerase [Colletotrichum camelliae filamentous virus 1]|uniref:RNA-dependent RNA polymerase n=1 Tax=Colletotrichum camelliae filamentous virus 1 TaxID=2029458 RepID=A0A286M3M8_9VIRU|nr:RNA-dependent RNA polymerase [Colletotrichum camelliae filamentous virus 1]ASV63092.1 RNA-dependent RNA polymerase [Colletotrichum camelliae filamentous virus 1]